MLFWLAIFGIGVLIAGAVHQTLSRRQDIKDEQARIEKRLAQKERDKELGIESKPKSRRRRR